MSMLSGYRRRLSAPRLKAACAPATFRTVGTGLQFKIAGVDAEATAEGALWIESARTLVVSDLHFEKGSSFAVRGQMLPPYDTRATLQRLTLLFARLRPDTVISLGDSFHDRDGPGRMDAGDVATLRAMTAAADWVWIEGNHDPEAPTWLGGRAMERIAFGDLVLRHEPKAGDARGEIAGHLHPCAKVSARGRALRARCFATDGERLVMPAFGAYTGGLNVRDAAFDPLFPQGCVALMLGRTRVYAAPSSRQTPDGA
ncbi:MAG: ligase-associated DNA damage response endonuclease PdeM [Alphaproteobacteria bacterium]|nr:ligase-associated DNA damage response endonuclease PdeM [Alphaproteobacteria bacterium]